jgi:hypothetical protein
MPPELMVMSFVERLGVVPKYSPTDVHWVTL